MEDENTPESLPDALCHLGYGGFSLPGSLKKQCDWRYRIVMFSLRYPASFSGTSLHPFPWFSYPEFSPLTSIFIEMWEQEVLPFGKNKNSVVPLPMAMAF